MPGRIAYKLTREATGTPMKETSRKHMKWPFHDPKTLHNELVDIHLKIYSKPDLQQHVLQSRDWAIYSWIDEIPKIQAPILFFWTTHKPTCPWPVADKVHQSVPGSRLCWSTSPAIGRGTSAPMSSIERSWNFSTMVTMKS